MKLVGVRWMAQEPWVSLQLTADDAADLRHSGPCDDFVSISSRNLQLHLSVLREFRQQKSIHHVCLFSPRMQ